VDDDTIVALRQSTRTCPVFSFAVLVRTRTTVPGFSCAGTRGVAWNADPAAEGSDRSSGGGGEARVQRDEERDRGCGDASVTVEPREWEIVDDGTSWRGRRGHGPLKASLEP